MPSTVRPYARAATVTTPWAAPLSPGLVGHRELVGLREVEGAVVAAEALRHQRRRRVAEYGGLLRGAVEADAAQEAGREGVAAAGGVDDLDIEGGDRLGALGRDQE